MVVSPSLLGQTVFDGFTVTAGNADSLAPQNMGGGVFVASSAALTIANCTFIGNSAFSGGGVGIQLGAPKLINCVFQGNSATASGGGLANSQAGSTVVNCTFVGNTAPLGGAIYTASTPQATFVNCTVVANAATTGGGVMGGPVALVNSIVRDNTAIVDPQLTASGATVTYSNIQGGWPGTGNIDADPLFVRNPSPGADGAWGTADDDYGDLRIGAFSPVVDAGNNTAVPSGVVADPDGNPRFADVATAPDTGSGTAPIVDIGAYEAVPLLSASAGGPYVVIQGQSIALNAHGASNVAGELQYAWEWSGDGLYDEASGSAADFDSSGRALFTPITVWLRVTDASAASIVAQTTITVVPPVLHVDANATGAGNGGSWEDAITDLAPALNQAIAGQEIRVAGGTYKPTTSKVRTVSFVLKNGVTLRGGYGGLGAVDPDARNATAHPSILSGDIGNPIDSSDNSYHVVLAIAVDETAVLDGFLITGGTATGTGQNSNGGGMYISRAAPTLINCAFLANAAASSGGGLYVTSARPLLVNCAFVGNSSSLNGGAMGVAVASAPRLINCTFTENNAVRFGGAIDSESSSPTLTNCILWNNTAFYGSQVRSGAGAVTVEYSDVQGGWTGIGNIDADPLFARAPSPGPDGQWGSADDDFGDLRIAPCSPAVDAGDTSAVPSGIITDLAGEGRFIDVPTSAHSGSGAAPMVDLGAYEAVPALAASAGGPYTVIQGQTLALLGLGASDVAGELQYAWEWSGDGLFDEAAGAAPAFPTIGWPLFTPIPLSLRVTDSAARTITSSTSVTVVPPVVYVDASAAGANTGQSWDDAATSLAAVLSAAIPGQQIRVAKGTYKPTTTASRSASFALKSGVALLGGYAGAGAPDPDVRDSALYPSVLSGDIGTPGNTSDNSYHVLTASGVDDSAVLDGFVITGGKADGPAFHINGGGMYAYSASATLINVVFRRNSASSGGGLYASLSPLSLAGCAFQGNTATRGAGLYIDIAAPRLANCTFSGNLAAASGGGLYNASGSSPVLTNCTFAMNVVSQGSGSGGAVYNTATAALTNCILWGNSATNGPQIQQVGSSAAIAVAYSAIQGGYTGAGNISADPRFVRNPSRGTDGVWGTADDDYGDLRLQPNSPCIDAGNNAALPADTLDLDRDGDTAEPIPFDLAGGPRRWDFPAVPDTGNGTAPVVDMGAYEATGLIVQGTSAADHLYLRLDPGGATVQMWLNADPSGPPTNTAPLDTPSPIGFAGGGADDTLTIDASNGNPVPASGIFFDGAGTGRIRLLGTSGADDLSAQAGRLTLNGNPIAHAGVGACVLESTGPAIALGSLSIADATIALAPGGKVLVTEALSITGSGRLNLADNDLIVGMASLPAVQALIRSGYNNGSWNGPGIISDLLGTDKALGYAAGNDPAIAHLGGQLNGQPFGPGSVIVKYTYFADGNLDGQVDVVDLGILATHWQGEGRTWTSADFNYSPDGKVDVVELGMLATNWQKGAGSPLGLPLDVSAFGLASAGDELEPVPPAPQVRIAAGRKVGMLSSGIGAIDFGTVFVSSQKPGPQRTFRVSNNGDDVLTLRLRKLPKGFTLLEPLERTLMPGESDTFTVQMSRKAPARHARALIRIDTNDATQARFDIPITGVVRPTSAAARRG